MQDAEIRGIPALEKAGDELYEGDDPAQIYCREEAFRMEYDLKTPEQQAEVCNVVRFAINRSQLSQEHLDYVIAAVTALYQDRDSIPNMRITMGHNLPMRHFHAFLEPYYV